MKPQTNEKNQDISRFLAQHPFEPLYAQFVKYTQKYQARSDLHYHDFPECGICLSGNGVLSVSVPTAPVYSGSFAPQTVQIPSA